MRCAIRRAALADDLPTLDAAFVVLGTGEPRYQALWRQLAAKYPQRIGARIGFDEPRAHLIEAGCDIFLMPSQFEPCGLNQMYSLRYGTVPVVRRTGGLADTVEQWDPTTGEGTGFVFDHPTAEGVSWALGRAVATFADRAAWRRLALNGMARDFTWATQARRYVELYRALAG